MAEQCVKWVKDHFVTLFFFLLIIALAADLLTFNSQVFNLNVG